MRPYRAAQRARREMASGAPLTDPALREYLNWIRNKLLRALATLQPGGVDVIKIERIQTAPQTEFDAAPVLDSALQRVFGSRPFEGGDAGAIDPALDPAERQRAANTIAHWLIALR